MRNFVFLLALCGITLIVPHVRAADKEKPISLNTKGCQDYFQLASAALAVNMSSSVKDCSGQFCVYSNVELWQGIVLTLAYGAFALLVTLVFKLIRSFIYYDSHLLDTFFDAGGDMNFALIACFVVAKYAWTSAYTWSSADTMQYGIVGGFWYASAMSAHLFLFAIMACEIRIKAPGAKTFLQVIYKRYGAGAHVTIMIFALFVNLVIAGVALTESSKIIAILTDDLSEEVVVIMVSLVVGLFSLIGGLGGAIYVAYFACALIISVMLAYLVDVFYDPLGRDGNRLGSWEEVWEVTQCGRGHHDNEGESILTFLSGRGMISGIVLLISGFSSTFVNQSFWQVSVAAKPGHAVWGFLVGGLTLFVVPLAASFVFGLGFWQMSLAQGMNVVSQSDALEGYLPVFVSQRLLGQTGDFLMFVMTLSVTMITASSEVLAMSSIIVYDIYQTYVSPFKPSIMADNQEIALRTRKVVQNEEYLEYDRRCVFLKHVIVLCNTVILVIVGLVLVRINVDLPWLLQMLGVVTGSCVIPVALAITWHRITAAGVISGSVLGFISGMLAWLAYAATYDGGLEKFRENTGREFVMLTASAVSLGVGGILTIVVSLSCGGCDTALLEEEEWEKTRTIDNPILPWSVKYAPDIQEFQRTKGTPHFYTVRRTYKCAEIAAYIIGVLLSVCVVLVWPACMLLADIFSKDTFGVWFMVVLTWLSMATAFVLLIPVIWEIVKVCQQAYYNRAWARSERHQRLDEDNSSEPRPARGVLGTISGSDKTSNYTTTDLQMPDGDDSSRWKTYIQLD